MAHYGRTGLLIPRATSTKLDLVHIAHIWGYGFSGRGGGKGWGKRKKFEI